MTAFSFVPHIPPAKDPFAELMVEPYAPIEVIEAAYRALTRIYHPDVAGPDGTSKMVRINAAIEELRDPDRRRDWWNKVTDREAEDRRSRIVPVAIMPFGKFEGELMSKVDLDYLRWLDRNADKISMKPWLRTVVRDELRRRETIAS